MAALLGSGSDSQDVTPQDYQDKMKKMADLFNFLSSSSPEVDVPASKSVHIKAPVCGASSQDATTSTSISPPRVTPIQQGKQQAKAGKVSGLAPSNLSNQMSGNLHMEVDLATSKSPPDEQHPPPIKEGEWVHV
jgi:hypothetical protein